MDLPSSLNSALCDARTSVGEPAQGVGSGGLFTVVEHDALAYHWYEFVVTCGYGTYKHLKAYLMLYAKDNTKEVHVVFGYKHTLWDSQTRELMVLQMLCRWLVQIAVRHAHTSPCLLLVAPLKVLTNVNVMVLAQSEEWRVQDH